jgi:hypothetical protein
MTQCEDELKYGDSYTSKEVHTVFEWDIWFANHVTQRKGKENMKAKAICVMRTDLRNYEGYKVPKGKLIALGGYA